MEPISVVDAITSGSKAQGASIAARAIASFGDEVIQLLAATVQIPASSTLGTKIDVKA